jgi:ribosomal-protein-alanine N-acetyltransferase
MSEVKAFVFSPMTEADIAAVVAIDQVAFAIPTSAESFRHELVHNPQSFAWVIRANPLLTGLTRPSILCYGDYWLLGDEAQIMTIATHPDWRHRGLGEWLLLEMIAQARSQGAYSVTLEVRVSNYNARSLYTKSGFEEVGLRKRYYRDNQEDALIMTLFKLDEATVWHPLVSRLDALRALANGV